MTELEKKVSQCLERDTWAPCGAGGLRSRSGFVDVLLGRIGGLSIWEYDNGLQQVWPHTNISSCGFFADVWVERVLDRGRERHPRAEEVKRGWSIVNRPEPGDDPLEEMAPMEAEMIAGPFPSLDAALAALLMLAHTMPDGFVD